MAAVRRRWLTASAGALAVAATIAVGAGNLLASTEQPDMRVRPILKTPPKGTRVNVDADRIVYDARTRIATATGQVVITYGQYELVATRVTYDIRNDKLTANGNIRLKEPGGNILEADEAELRNRFRDGFARHLMLLLTNDASVTADYAQRSDGYLTVYDNVTYTRCKRCPDPGKAPFWQLRSEQVTHDEREGTIYHKNASLELGGVPVFTLPYLSHPDPTVDRRTGFLVPVGRYTDAYGVGVEIPYFWAPAPNYDLTFRPLITSKQGLVAQAEWRHALPSGRYSIGGAGVYQLTEDEPPGDTTWRGALQTEGRFRLAPNWHYGWEGTLVSDDTFLRRYDIDDSDEAISRLYVDGIDDRNYFSVQALHFRSLIPAVEQDHIPVAAPYIQQSFTFERPVLGGELGLDSSAYSVYREDPLSAFTGIDLAERQTRATSNLHWKRQTILDGGQIIEPFAELRADFYMTEDLPGGTADTDTTVRVLPQAGVDMRWPFFTATEGGRHVLSPVAQVIVSGSERNDDDISNEDAITLNFDHSSVFLHDRFTGYDRYEGGLRANAGLLYTFLDDDGGFFRFSMGESFHLAGDNSFVDGSGLDSARSDIVTAVAWQPNENLTFNYQMRFAEDLSAISLHQGGIGLTFDRISGSLNYLDIDAEPAYGRAEAERQVWGNLKYSWENGWSVFAGLRFDVKDTNVVDDSFGIGYENECTSIALTYKEDYDSDVSDDVERSVFLRVELKTLGSATVGSQVN
jgi:LPS-assembly protein